VNVLPSSMVTAIECGQWVGISKLGEKVWLRHRGYTSV